MISEEHHTDLCFKKQKQTNGKKKTKQLQAQESSPRDEINSIAL